MRDEKTWTAALCVIGDEMLSGRTQDKNVVQLATWLNDQGIEVFRIPTLSLALVVVLGALAGMVAAMFPGRRAARLDVLHAVVTE